MVPRARGQVGYFPPLAGNPDLAKDPSFALRVVLDGLSGAITVNGQRYDGSMPGFRHLSDADIAAVVDFVGGAWGNMAPGAAITPDAVARQRREAMSAAEVHAYRERLR